MRFLAAMLACKQGRWILTGSQKLKQRPIAELVKALKQLGANIVCIERNNYPPLEINGCRLNGTSVEIDSGISSQFISALLLISPLLSQGLEIKFKGETVSAPYINMTVSLLKEFGMKVTYTKTGINVGKPSGYQLPEKYTIEADWSSASYWYSICALSEKSKISLPGLKKNSLQADSVLPQLYNDLGVKTSFVNGGIEIRKQAIKLKAFNYDFTNCPDIAQTIAVTCFGLGIKAKLTGLQTLKLKETDRIEALVVELTKLGAIVNSTHNSLTLSGKANSIENKTGFTIKTFHDHRMAMSFAPLALICPSVEIDDAAVVKKSYPAFWKDLKNAGFNVNLQP
jgi:3-phosphoshikimate 1-carboxyvinyltransferase